MVSPVGRRIEPQEGAALADDRLSWRCIAQGRICVIGADNGRAATQRLDSDRLLPAYLTERPLVTGGHGHSSVHLTVPVRENVVLSGLVRAPQS